MLLGGKRKITATQYSETADDDSWEWDGVRWEQRQVGMPGPEPRRRHRLAYDAARRVTVLYGGRDGSTETWTWDGMEWRLASRDGGSEDQWRRRPRHLSGGG